MSDHDAALAWAGEQLDAGVVEARQLLGGQTSVLLAVTTDGGREAVLRLITNEPWRTHGVELATRESTTQAQLASHDVPAPTTIALDATGERCGHPAHLMSLLTGSTDLDRVDDGDLAAIARLLVRIHAVEASPPPRAYQTWAPPVKYVVPPWTHRPDVWMSAFDLLREEPPPFSPVFLHRDFSPRNLLWDDDRDRGISGAVDWVETSTGPAWLDVAHCRTNLVLEHDADRGDAFVQAYVELTGCAPAPYFDVMDVVGFLPTPGRPRPDPVNDPAARQRLESHLATVLS